MKAVAQIDLDGLYVEDVLVEDSFIGVQPVYKSPEPLESIFEEGALKLVGEEEINEAQELIGYLVGIPVTPGLYRARFDLKVWNEQIESETQQSIEYWSEGLTLEEIEELTRPVESEPSELDRIGFALVQRELEALELRQQNEALGGQIVEKEIQMMNMQAQNDALGASLVGFELRLIMLESNQNTQTEGENLNV